MNSDIKIAISGSNDHDDRLLKPEEAAARLNISPYTLRDWLRAGKFPGIKVGNLWRIRESDLPTKGLSAEKVNALLRAYDIDESRSADITAQILELDKER